MGYYAHMTKAEFRIPSEDRAGALKAVKALIGSGKETCHGSSGRHFMWVEPEEVLAATTLAEALKAWGWLAEIAGATICPTCGRGGYGGDVVGISFEAEKLGDEDILFAALAPFVYAGCYIEMRGEDGEVWRWCFDGERVSRREGRLTWD